MKIIITSAVLFVFAVAGYEVLYSEETPADPTPVADQAEGKQKTADAKDAEEGEPEKVVRTDREWRKKLTREQYRVLRQKGTERPFVNKYDKHFKAGHYECTGCGQVLFESDTKFNSGCGWPAFYAAKAEDRVVRKADYSMGMQRVEVLCARCDSHLGHVFPDGFGQPTGERFCINSVCLKFVPKKREKPTSRRQTAKEKEAEKTEKPEKPAEDTPEAADEAAEPAPEETGAAGDSPGDSE